MTLKFGDSCEATCLEEAFELDPWLLAAPLISAAKDWLALQGREPGPGACARLGWDLAPGSERCLIVELHEGDAVLWQGMVPRDELTRIATRAGRALQAAGAWPLATEKMQLTWVCTRVAGDPSLESLASRGFAQPPSSGSSLGIEITATSSGSANAAASAELLPVVAWEQFSKLTVLSQDADPDLFVVFRKSVWGAVVAMLDESMRVHQERAVYLYGRRSRIARDSGFLPLFELTRCEVAQHVHASATRLVLDHTALLDPAAPDHAALALLHTHMPGVGLAASDPDLRDIDDINTGGPSAISMIFEAQFAQCQSAAAFSVYARLGARSGHVHQCRTCVAVVEEGVVHEPHGKEANRVPA